MSSIDTYVTVTVVHRDVRCCVLALRGELSLRSAGTVAAALSKALLDVGRVLVDVSGVQVQWAPAAQIFPSTAAALGGWPWSRLVLFGAGPELAETLGALRVPEAVPLAPDEAAAQVLLEHRPPVVTRTLDLERSLSSPRRARWFVGGACDEWRVEALRDDAVLVASELVTNAVQHADTSCRLVVRLDETGLTIAVRDHRPGPLTLLRAVDPTGQAGHGLVVVAAACRQWGVSPTGDGKTVWALLTPPGTPR